jgi:hypothetical protein
MTQNLRSVDIACMSTKTVSLKKEAYDRLRAARRYPGESFSDVVLRARWRPGAGHRVSRRQSPNSIRRSPSVSAGTALPGHHAEADPGAEVSLEDVQALGVGSGIHV